MKKDDLKVICIIPARLASSRFPNKPLAKIIDQPMILHVFNKVKDAPEIDKCIVATCDNEIKMCIENSGGEAVMTSNLHERASDRCAEALLKIEEKYNTKYDIVLMVQGDEPLINHNMIQESISPFYSDSKIRSMAKRDATRNHNNVTWGIAGLGSCVTGIFAAGIGAGVAGFPGFLLGGFGGLFLPYSSVDNYNPKLNYPDEIRGLDEKKLYKDTYLKQARKLAKQSMSNGPIYVLVGAGFMMLMFATY